MSDHGDELTALVRDSISDIIYDHVNYDTPVKTEIESKDLQVIGIDEDDGVVAGDYRLIVNGGQFVFELTADAVFQGFTDCWDNSSESHFTKDVYYDELQDFHCSVTKFTMDTRYAGDAPGEIEVENEGC